MALPRLDAQALMGAALLAPAALDRLMPMHLQIAADGHVVHVGPTLGQVSPVPLEGLGFKALMGVLQPRGIQDLAGLRAADGGQVRFRLATEPEIPMKGLCVPTHDGGALLNLSFGYAVTSAVEHFHLTCGDFACTDLTIEMLFLIEAKSAAQEEQRKLNMRLQGDKQRAEAEALSDGLTGLANRRAFDAALMRCIENGAPFAVMQIDLDFFKAVNDTLGHAAGDAVLAKVAAVLKKETRACDLVARVGGDEFSILFVRFVDVGSLLDVAGRMIAHIEEPLPFGKQACEISASIGIAVAQGAHSDTAADLVHKADTALYASKFAGRRQATIYSQGLEEKVARNAADLPLPRQ